MPAEISRTAGEIEARLGFVPPFFAPALDDPALLDHLWRQALAAYIDSPLPPLLREQLFAHLSRYCAQPYCIVTHACGLHALGAPAAGIYALLSAPIAGDETDAMVRLLDALDAPLAAWPSPDAPEWRALLCCAVAAQRGEANAPAARDALRRALGDARYNHLAAFLAYVAACHAWAEAHPEISYEDDRRAIHHLRQLLGEEPRLRGLFASHAARARAERAATTPGEYHTFIDAIPEFAWKLDPAGDMIFINRGWCEYTGVHDIEEARRRWLEFVHPEDLPRLVDARQRALATGEKLNIEYRVRAADGSYRAFLARALPLRNDAGDIAAWYAVATDIEEIRRAEAALASALAQTEAARSLLDTLFSRSPVGMLFVDTQLRLVRINAALAAINGHSVTGQIGQRVEDIVPALWPVVGPVYERVLATRQPALNVEVSGTTDAMPGIRRHWLVNYYPVESVAGEMLGVAGIAIEITERREAEARIQALYEDSRRIADELRVANAAKDEFLGMISHELKTPITTIYGNARVLLSRGHLVDEQARAEALGDIAHEADRLRRVIDNLLVLARLESGHRVGREPLLLGRMAAALVRDHRQRFPGRAISLHADDATLAPVGGDPIYVEQVIRNLLGNAEKYSGGGGEITVEVAREGDEVALRVLDRGPGFCADDAARLFEPFFRGADAAERASGMGVGLSVCKRLIEALNGRIWGRPRDGGGAEFGFALPLAVDEDHPGT